MGWYPKRSHYYQSVAEGDEIEQGDIFWGVPSLTAAHPTVGDAFHSPGDLPIAEDLEPPRLSEVQRGINVVADPVIVIPHTCDFYGPEKGRAHRARLVARIQSVRDSSIVDPSLLRSGDGYRHTFFLPDWESPTRGEADRFVNLRQMTTVDASYLSRRRRLARLSPPAVISLRRRLAQFFTDYAPMPSELVEADESGGLIRGERDLIAKQAIQAAYGTEAAEILRMLFDPRGRGRSGETRP
jgi:hypothetical protein